jgi:hypothetical protein
MLRNTGARIGMLGEDLVHSGSSRARVAVEMWQDIAIGHWEGAELAYSSLT